MEAELRDLTCRRMKNNIIIMGVKEDENENCLATENKVKLFMKRNLKMTTKQEDTIDF